VKADEGLYDAIFPPGEQLAMDGDLVRSGPSAECEIRVDGELTVQVNTFPAEDDFESMAALGPSEVEMNGGEEIAGEYNALVWPGVAMASAKCSWQGYTDGYTLALWASHPEGDESKEVLSDLIQPYMRATVESIPCEPYN
jgi:hypothetical protein